MFNLDIRTKLQCITEQIYLSGNNTSDLKSGCTKFVSSIGHHSAEQPFSGFSQFFLTYATTVPSNSPQKILTPYYPHHCTHSHPIHGLTRSCGKN
jgi:hypothetical protein